MAVPAAPASAADVDEMFTYDLTSTTIPLGVRKKRIHLRFTNLTDKTPVAVEFHVHPVGPDWYDKASVEWPERGGSGECDGDYDSWYCYVSAPVVPELLPAPGGTVDLPIDVYVREKHEPFERSFRIKVGMALTKYDKMQFSDYRLITLSFVNDLEADLAVVAPDVKQSVRVGAGGSLEPTGALNPGETGVLRYRIVNQGRKAVSGVKVTLRLPENVTFTRPSQECVIDDDGRSVVCTYDTLALVPAVEDTDPTDGIHSAVELRHLVAVPADLTAPVTLTGGIVQVEGLTEGPADRLDTQSTPERTVLPANAVAVPAADLDASDNQDGYAVVVAGKKDDGNGGGGGLPVTGPQAGLFAGAGLAMVAAGVVLLLARRRRSVAFVSGEDTTAS
ncbi:hypothetical protein [Micromonospora sp. NPDC049374]|uniref:hypothetical protein n=1 Tax=Micromonospora sp. NPDC049374 TaxID=3154352 RepID=UPI0034498480